MWISGLPQNRPAAGPGCGIVAAAEPLHGHHERGQGQATSQPRTDVGLVQNNYHGQRSSMVLIPVLYIGTVGTYFNPYACWAGETARE